MKTTTTTIDLQKGGLTIVECKSGRYLAYFDNPTNIVSNGDTKEEALRNLNTMLATILNSSYSFFGENLDTLFKVPGINVDKLFDQMQNFGEVSVNYGVENIDGIQVLKTNAFKK